MSIIAAYYGLPVLSVRAATFHQMLRNQHGYKVGRVGYGLGVPAASSIVRFEANSAQSAGMHYLVCAAAVSAVC